MKQNNNFHINERLNFVRITLLVLFFLLFFKLFIVQVFWHNDYANLEEQYNEIYIKKENPRGEIYDTNGNLVVGNVEKYNFYYLNAVEHSNEEKIQIAKDISRIIDIETDFLTTQDLKDQYLINCDNYCNELITDDEWDLYYNDKLTMGEIETLKRSRVDENDIQTVFKEYGSEEIVAIKVKMDQSTKENPVIIKEDLSESEIYNIKAAVDTIPSIYVSSTYERYYPYENTLSTLLGNIDNIPKEKIEFYQTMDYEYSSQVGITYLEQELEGILSAIPSVYRIELDDNGYIIEQELIQEGYAGNDVKLTIDIEFQQEIEQILESTITAAQNNNSSKLLDSGYIMAMDPQTGDIIGMAGKGMTEDNQNVYDASIGNFTNAYEVGSVVKMASLLTAYTYGDTEYNEVKLDENLYIGANSQKKGSWTVMGSINEFTAIAKSSNVYFFKLFLDLAGVQYVPYQSISVDPIYFNIVRQSFEEYGLGNETWLDFENTVTGVEGNETLPGFYLDLANGQYDTYSNMQLVSYISTIANDGMRLKPQYVESVHTPNYGDELGEVIYETKPALISESNASKEDIAHVQETMLCTVNCSEGLATNLQGKSYNPTAKTGTAETFVKVDDNLIYTHTSAFVGFAPYDDPEIAIAIILPYYRIPDLGSGGVQSVTLSNQVFDAYFK